MKATGKGRARLARTALMVMTVAGCLPSPVSPSSDDETAPSMGPSVVVWEDYRNAETDGADVYLYDAVAQATTRVAGGRGDQEQPAVSDRYVVWIDSDRLVAKDRVTGGTFNVTNGPAAQTDPALCGSVVVWTDNRNGSPDVYARDLAGGDEVPVAVSPAVEAYPACDAGRVVFMYAPAGQWASILRYDLASGTTAVVAADPWNDWRPAISGDYVVWQAWPNQPDAVTGIQIHGSRLSTGAQFVVTDAGGNQRSPAISGSVVVWEDSSTGVDRLWWRDLAVADMQPTAVDANQPGRQQSPAVAGRFAAFQSDASGVWNIDLVFLPAPG